MFKLSSEQKWNVIYFLIFIYLIILAVLKEGSAWLATDDFALTLMLFTGLLCGIYIDNPARRKLQAFWFTSRQKPVPWLIEFIVILTVWLLCFIPGIALLFVWLSIRNFIL